jgi:hypothetical protein
VILVDESAQSVAAVDPVGFANLLPGMEVQLFGRRVGWLCARNGTLAQFDQFQQDGLLRERDATPP